MTKKYRIAYLLSFLGSLLLVNLRVSGSFSLPTGDKAIWFHAGLLLLIFGSYWVESYFTKPADVVVNGMTTFIAVSLLVSPPFPEWWNALRYWSLGLSSLAFLTIWLGGGLPTRGASKLSRAAYHLVVRLGSAKILCTAVFLLSLVSYFDLRTREAKILVLFWGLILLIRELEVHELLDKAWELFGSTGADVLGFVSSFKYPNVARFRLHEGVSYGQGKLVAFVSGDSIQADSPIGIVTGPRISVDSTELEVAVFDSAFNDGKTLENRRALSVDPDDAGVKERLAKNGLYSKMDGLIGYARRGTEISRLQVELTKRTQLEEGHLVSVQLPKGGDVLFQLVEGELHQESVELGSDRCFTIATAEQIGTWNSKRSGFETYSWVVPENSLAFHVLPDGKAKPSENADLETVGAVPNSSFPVNVNIKDLVCYHSAVLGVTGSGKSFLAYQLIERLAKDGVKVICLDVTGDYKRYIQNAVLMNEPGDCKRFLDDKTLNKIGIVEFLDDRIHPVKAAKLISKIAYDWCRENRKEDEIKEPRPKVLLVFEEAHTLVPEWNYNPAKELQALVNETSQIVLQARKFGLGFMIITQRTANVTKSILNQCNTIFAFQAYDETGFDFMKNYMGERYVRTLPNLKRRHGVLVGKASASDRPLIVQFKDQVRQLNLTVPKLSELIKPAAPTEPAATPEAPMADQEA